MLKSVSNFIILELQQKRSVEQFTVAGLKSSWTRMDVMEIGDIRYIAKSMRTLDHHTYMCLLNIPFLIFTPFSIQPQDYYKAIRKFLKMTTSYCCGFLWDVHTSTANTIYTDPLKRFWFAVAFQHNMQSINSSFSRTFPWCYKALTLGTPSTKAK